MIETRVLLITGLPGTGKTTLARRLAARYRAPLIAKDLVKEPLLDVLGADDAAQSRRLSDASFAVLFAVARELVRTNCSLVLEGNFRSGEHESPLRAVLHSIDGRAVTARFAQVLCTVDEAERVARLSARRTDSTRHAGHRHGELAAVTGAGFLDLPGERFVHGGANSATLLPALDDWWKLRNVSAIERSAGEPDR